MGGLKSKLRRPKSSTRKEKDGSAPKQKPRSKKANLPESQSARKTVDPRLPFSNYRQIFSIRNAWKAISRAMEENAKETLISLLHQHPEHRDKLPDIKGITDDDEMRTSETFENVAMDIYQVFDDVINNLENVDAALKDIRNAARSFPLNKHMLKDMDGPFVETIKLTLGYERFPEATENNYKLLYQFVQEEIGKHLTEVEVNSDIGCETAIKIEENSEPHDKENVDSESDDVVNKERPNEEEITPDLEDGRGS